MVLRNGVGPLVRSAFRNSPSSRPQQSSIDETQGLPAIPETVIRPLTSAEWVDSVRLWDRVQRTADRDPAGAIEEAHWLMHQLMCARGFPMAEFDDRGPALEQVHPRLIAAYRDCRSVYVAHVRGELNPQTLDESFGAFRALFAELLDVDGIMQRALAGESPPKA